jgi:hypothetical protein
MLRVTQDIVELRHWAEARGGRPCREERSGRLGFSFPDRSCNMVEVGWDEFEPTFAVSRQVLVYDDAPGATTWFIGGEEEAKSFLCGSPGFAGASAHL